MRILGLIILLLIFHTPVYATNQWYDDKGNVHFTLDEPPADAKTKDGSMWWKTEIEEEDEELIKQGIQQAHLNIENDNAPEPMSGNHTLLHIEEVSYQEPKEEEPEADEVDGFSIPSFSLFKWWDSTRVDPGEPTATLYGIWGSSKDNIFVVGTSRGIPVWHKLFLGRGGIFHYDGHKWSEMSSPDDEFLDGIVLYGVWGSSSSDVYAVGSDWTILYFDGIEWSRIETGVHVSRLYPDVENDLERSPLDGFWSVWGSSVNDIYAVGNSAFRGGVALHFNGVSWRQIALPEKTNEIHHDLYRCVWGTSAENVFILGALGRVYHYDGNTWEKMYIGQSVDLGIISGTSDNNVFAAGSSGRLFHYNGEEWNQIFGLEGMYFKGIWGSSTKNVYASGTSFNVGAIYHYNGTKWKRIKTVNKDHLIGIWGHGDSDVFAVGTRSLILHYSGMSMFTFAIGALAFGLGIFGWRFIRK